MKAYHIILSAFLLLCVGCTAEFKKCGDVLIDSQGKTIDGDYGYAINGQTFQQDAVCSFNGYQYITYYNADDRLCLARRNLQTDSVEIIVFTDYIYKGGQNAHCTPSVGICPGDGSIHLAFDHHNDILHYRHSPKGVALQPQAVKWEQALFTPVKNTLGVDTIRGLCYPRFLQTPQGELQFLFRLGGSGDGVNMMADYNIENERWENLHAIDSGKGNYEDGLGTSDSRCAYPNGYTYDRFGVLHTSFVWRESSMGTNHDILYVYSKDGGNTWLNGKQDTVGTRSGVKVSINSDGICAIPLGRNSSLMNSQGQAVDSEGNLHCVMWHIRDEVDNSADGWFPQYSSYFHYFKDSSGKWHRTEIKASVGNRPAMGFDSKDNLYVAYLSNDRYASWKNSIYFSQGQLMIWKAQREKGWKDWKLIYTDTDTYYLNEVKMDEQRLKQEGILSLFLQETPAASKEPSSIRILDFKLE